MSVRGTRRPRHLGPNLLANAGFRTSSTSNWPDGTPANGWTFTSQSDATATCALWHDSPDWTLRDGDIPSWDGIGAPYGSTVALHSTKSTGTFFPQIYSADVPAVAGARYSCGVLLGNHRATSVFATLTWLDTTGATISTVSLPPCTQDYSGSAWLVQWFHSRLSGIMAPATTVAARLAIVLQTPYTSGTDMWAFIDRAWLREEDSPV